MTNEELARQVADAEQQAKAEQAMRDEIQRKLDEANERARAQLERIEEVRNRHRDK